MALKACFLAYTKAFARKLTPVKGGKTKVTANVILLIPDTVVNYFNIPIVDKISVQTQRVKTYTRVRFDGLLDITGTAVKVPAYKTAIGSGSRTRNLVVLPHQRLKTPKGKPRACSICFPWFFTVNMISQALGTMIRANKPNCWRLGSNGRSYPFVFATTGLMPGSQSGAWVVSSLVTPTNVDETNVVRPVSFVFSQSKARRNP